MTQIYDAAAEYDRQLLDQARALCALSTPSDMREYLATYGNGYAANITSDTCVYYILGRLQAVTAELVRWIDRIPEAHRG
jgi:hypothetical protein